MLRSLVFTMLPFVASMAFEHEIKSDSEAQDEYNYIRRMPVCATLGDSTDTAPTPKIIHQMWWQGEAAVPPEYAPLRATWAATHPGWTIKLWDETAVTTLINSSYAWFAPTFHALPAGIQKADAARYAILHAEGGVYADLDVEAFHALDEVLAPQGTAPTVHLFEEPATHWDAHHTVISNGMMAAPPNHPLPLALLRSIRPIAAVFASGGSHLVQSALTRCDAEEEEAAQKKGVAKGGTLAGVPPCGCYVTHSSADFFPLHASMRLPNEYDRVGEHADAARNLVEEIGAGTWPPERAYTAQHWTGSWIDSERGQLWLRGVTAARANETQVAEKLLLAAVWSRWGHRFKYANSPNDPEPDRAKGAYERSLHWWPEYGFAHYELGNLALEAAGLIDPDSTEARQGFAEAADHFTEAVRCKPDSLLFVNNLGVALMNQNKPEEAMAHFSRVLELHQSGGSFATIKGLDPAAGAHLNLGFALQRSGQREAAHAHWLQALAMGNYEHAVQAVQRLVADEASHVLPPTAVLDLTFGEALAKEGRTREAALRFAAAHVGAANLTSAAEDAGVTAEGLREVVKARMAALAEVWDDGEGALAETAGATKPVDPRLTGGARKVQLVQASPDGTMSRTEMTQEDMMRSIKAQQKK